MVVHKVAYILNFSRNISMPFAETRCREQVLSVSTSEKWQMVRNIGLMSIFATVNMFFQDYNYGAED